MVAYIFATHGPFVLTNPMTTSSPLVPLIATSNFDGDASTEAARGVEVVMNLFNSPTRVKLLFFYSGDIMKYSKITVSVSGYYISFCTRLQPFIVGIAA